MLAVPGIVEPALGSWGALLSLERGADLDALIGQRITDGIKMILIAGAVVGLPLMILVILTQAAVAGSLNFAPKAMSFKGNRINPLKGLARMVSMKALVELGKASLKVVLLIWCCDWHSLCSGAQNSAIAVPLAWRGGGNGGEHVSGGSWRAFINAGGDCPS